jgi:hypothetical protein
MKAKDAGRGALPNVDPRRPPKRTRPMLNSSHRLGLNVVVSVPKAKRT